MKDGNWVPVSKGFSDSLPRTRKFSELEAIYSLQLDYDENKDVTLAGYSSRWGWSREKIRKFLADNGVEIEYPTFSEGFKNKRGKLKKTLNKHKKDIKETKTKHKRFIDNKELSKEKDIKKTLNKHKKDIKCDDTIETINTKETKTKKKIYEPAFLKLKEDYESKTNTLSSKTQTYKNWITTKKILPLSEEDIYKACMNSIERQKQTSKTNDVMYYKLSNLLSGQKYRADLPDLVDWKPEVIKTPNESKYKFNPEDIGE